MSISYQFGDVDAHGALIRAQAASLEAEHQSIVRDVLAAGDFWGGSGSVACQEFITQLGRNFQVIYEQANAHGQKVQTAGNNMNTTDNAITSLHAHIRRRDMPTRFMTDPHEMRAMAGRFDVHAQTVEDEARKMWASSQNIAGAGWSGTAQATSYDTMGQMNTAFRNIVNMLHGVRDGLIRDANNYEAQEQSSQQILSS